ncbi:MAG TPA: MFS transporter [Azospirillaceae bacterium]|nr:MFS transporter [Azospirillaceae bacterium]
MRKAWIVVACAALIVTLSMGLRQSFGLFLRPITMDLGVGRDVYGMSMAISNLLWGVAGPFVGILADRYGAGKAVASGAVLYILGLLYAAVASTPLDLYLSLGVLVGFALSGTTFAIVFGAVSRAVPPEGRSLAFGLVGAGGSFGQFAVVPISQSLLSTFGWSQAFLLMTLAAALMIALAVGVAGKASPSGTASAADQQTLREALREAGGHSGYWLLVAGFFVCGFHVAFIATHLPAFLKDEGLPDQIGASALALIGLFNIAGSYLFGLWGGTYRKKRLLSGLYLARAAVFAIFLVLPITPVTALVFAAGVGFLWLGTVPLTSGLVAQIFGIRYLSTLYGIVFLSHQVGSFLGAWFAGYAYDALGSYDSVWWISVALGLFAAIVHWPIRDVPVTRPQAVPSGAA